MKLNVELAAAVEAERHLLADEEAVTVDEPERALDRVVVRERDEVHAPPERPLVDVERIGVAFPADVLQHGDLGAARVPGVDVQVAAHQPGPLWSIGPSAPAALVRPHGHCTRRRWRRREANANIR